MAVINGTPGPDALHSSLPGDIVNGLGGNDRLYQGDDGNEGNPASLVGGAGNDTYYVKELLYMGGPYQYVEDSVVEASNQGIDTVYYTGNNSYLLPDNVENLRITFDMNYNYAPYASGNALDNNIRIVSDSSGWAGVGGGAGNDTIVGSASADEISGDSGADLLSGLGGDDALYGGAGNDRVLGGIGNDTLSGGGGNDVLVGGAGNDVLYADTGHDSLAGGTGADRFFFSGRLNAAANHATIVDFRHAQHDKIVLSDGTFAGLASLTHGHEAGDEVALAARNFRVGTAAHDANDYVIYDPRTGTLSYDADGTGPQHIRTLATISGHPSLTAGDFLVFAHYHLI